MIILSIRGEMGEGGAESTGAGLGLSGGTNPGFLLVEIDLGAGASGLRCP